MLPQASVSWKKAAKDTSVNFHAHVSENDTFTEEWFSYHTK